MSGESDPSSEVTTDPELGAGYIEIGVTVPKSFEEELADYLIENITGGSGLVLEDQNDDVVIRFYIPADGTAEPEIERIGSFLAATGKVTAESIGSRITSKRINEIDWVTEYRKKFEPVEIGDVVVRSAWSNDKFPGKLVITIEPKMAFGTGRHETTQLCIEAVKRAVKDGDTVLDLGTGSGILAILAAKLGAVEILGLDINTAAVENARENAALNYVNDAIRIEFGSMHRVESQNHYDIVVSNLIRDGIFELFDDFVRATRPGGLMILSGILSNQIDEMNRFFERKGYSDFEITTKNEWVCYTMRV
jgi:ribosomal protein L11 methyltransferase